MKIAEVTLWRFRCFGAGDPTDAPATPKPLKIDLDAEVTALIGRNGSGKSALLAALLRLFGETREERTIRQEDFFVTPGETLESQQQRQLFVEVRIVFPELAKGAKGRKDGEKTVPSAFRHLIVDGPKGQPFARIRLEATWELSGTLDGLIEENVYWLLTADDVPFGEPKDASIKQRMSASDRASIVMRYIPASRDVTALTKLTVRSLGRSLMQSVIWEHKEKIAGLLEKAKITFDSEKSLDRINEAINKCWTELNTADTETKARISVLPPDFQQIIRAASVILEPSPVGRTLGIEDLSDGQRSLFHFALVKSLLDFKLALEAEVAAGKKPPFHASFMRAPALTLFAFEEPENHLAPYFLSRLMTELQTLSKTQRVQGVVTSHSPAIVGRLEPRALRHLRRNRKTGIAGAAKLVLPEGDDEAAKFVREAVRAHPEIYFARHAIFGEGASEEIVLPRLAEAMGVPIDRSFVAIVPIGGRHVEHFWRLVSQLGIPHTTLLDLDLGRSSGDIAQFKAIANAILKLGEPLNADDKKNIDVAATLGDRGGWGVKGGWNEELIRGWMEFFETRGVFFSAPLDLDMLMLEALPAAYKKLSADRKGPQKPDEAPRQEAAADRVLGEGGFGKAAYSGSALMPLFPWYSYLFMGDRGKPAVHLSALAQLEDLALDLACPPVLNRLIKRVKQELELSGE